jgi:NB-ARC domain
VGRDQLIDHVRQRLSDDSASIALNGLPGVGKTALAITLASDPDLRVQFPGGILWAALGPHPNVSEILSRWGALFGIAASGMGTLKDTEIWARTLQGAIGTRRFLIVIDDLWDIDAALALKVGGPHCAYLVTTRFPQIAASFAMKGAIKVSELSEEDGSMLLQRLAPEVANADAEMVRVLVRSVGALPLALTLVGRHLFIKTYGGQSRRFRLAIEQLRQVEYRLRLSEPSAPTDASTNLSAVSLQAVIALSDEYLDAKARQTLRDLSVFPAKPNTFSEEAALAVSGVPVEGLDALIDAGLLEINGADRYTLHQAITDYARLQQNGENASRRFAEYYTAYIREQQKNIEHLQLESQILTHK